jgi:hypothetical protein
MGHEVVTEVDRGSQHGDPEARTHKQRELNDDLAGPGKH